LSVGCRQLGIEEGQRDKEKEKARQVGDGDTAICHVFCLPFYRTQSPLMVLLELCLEPASGRIAV
jgi:hypothetical protein